MLPQIRLSQCVGTMHRQWTHNVEATGLWPIVKGEVGDSTSTWLAPAGVPSPHDVIGKQKNGEKTTGSSSKIDVDDDGSEEAAAVAAVAAGSGALAAAMGVIVASSPSLSNCNDLSASQAAADDDAERQQRKVISTTITTSKDIEKLTEKVWVEKLILLKQANYKDYKFERTYDDEEQSSVWFQKIDKLDQLKKRKFMKSILIIFSNSFTQVDIMKFWKGYFYFTNESVLH